MVTLGTALTPGATKVMMCGCGELGKEVVIELKRLGVHVIAVARGKTIEDTKAKAVRAATAIQINYN